MEEIKVLDDTIEESGKIDEYTEEVSKTEVKVDDKAEDAVIETVEAWREPFDTLSAAVRTLETRIGNMEQFYRDRIDVSVVDSADASDIRIDDLFKVKE